MEGSGVNQSEAQAREVDALNQQALGMLYQHPDQAAQLLEQARNLAQTGAFAGQPYKDGLADSLSGLVKFYLETQPELAAQYCLQILALLDDSPVTHNLIDAKNALGWIYFYLGDYSTAMDWALQALRLSQEFFLSLDEAAALDLLANIYGMTYDLTQALSAHEAALKIDRANAKADREAKSLNNMAMTLLAMGNLDAALEAAQKSLRIFLEMQMPFDIANGYDTLAQVYLSMGNYEQAETNLLKGLQILESTENQIIKTYMLKTLGRVYLAQKNLSKSIDYLEHALAMAQQNGLRADIAECHQLLAEALEGQSDFPGALQHYKQFYEVNKEITGDSATKRLALLNVIHAVENAKHEAEIYRLRNIELQSEIDERKRIQVALEELATRDPLTGLFNRRHFIEKSEQEYVRSIRYRHPMAVIMIDLDHFKRINDTYGHPIGDQALMLVGKRLKSLMRTVDICGRMGGEEFALVLPETTLAGGAQAAERICQSFSNEFLPVSADSSIRLTVSIGVTCFLRDETGSPQPFDTLLQQADRAMYVAKNAGRNQVQVYE